MNPIENLWGYLVAKLNKARKSDGVRHHVRDANNADELFNYVTLEWNKLNQNQEFLESFIESMPSRLQAVIDKEGGWSGK